MTEVVHHFGLHNAEGVWFLHQDSGGVNALGVTLESPFEVRVRGQRSPHRISLAADADPSVLPDHPLVRRMLPNPQPGLTVVVDSPGLVSKLHTLTRLCSPARAVLAPMWVWSLKAWVNEAYLTNAAPLVITAARESDTNNLSRLAEAMVGAPRRVIVVTTGAVAPPFAERLPGDVPDLSHLPLEEIGGTVCRSWMRGEEVWNSDPTRSTT